MVRVVGIDHLVIRVSDDERSKAFYSPLADRYAVFFLDPDGLKLEGMKYGERQALQARRRASGAGKGRAASPL